MHSPSLFLQNKESNILHIGMTSDISLTCNKVILKTLCKFLLSKQKTYVWGGIVWHPYVLNFTPFKIWIYMAPPNEWPRSDHDNERSPPTSSLHVALLAWDVGIRDVVEVGSVVAYHGLTKHKAHGNLKANSFTPKFPNLPFMFAQKKTTADLLCSSCVHRSPPKAYTYELWDWDDHDVSSKDRQLNWLCLRLVANISQCFGPIIRSLLVVTSNENLCFFEEPRCQTVLQ